MLHFLTRGCALIKLVVLRTMSTTFFARRQRDGRVMLAMPAWHSHCRMACMTCELRGEYSRPLKTGSLYLGHLAFGAIESVSGLGRLQHRCFALAHHMRGTAHRGGRIDRHDLAHDQPIK
jgi:hypothetical protein